MGEKLGNLRDVKQNPKEEVNADSIAKQLENSEPIDLNNPNDDIDKPKKINKFGELES